MELEERKKAERQKEVTEGRGTDGASRKRKREKVCREQVEDMVSDPFWGQIDFKPQKSELSSRKSITFIFIYINLYPSHNLTKVGYIKKYQQK